MSMTMTAVNNTVPGATVLLASETNSNAAHLRRLVQCGAAILQELDDLDNQLQEINGAIVDEASQYAGHAETLHIRDESIECAVCFGSEILVDDVDTLREILGDSFDELVMVTQYHPDPRLIAMAADADNPQAKQIAACLRVQEAASSVNYSL